MRERESTYSMEFEKRKAAVLASLGSVETDKSPKGTLDTPILPLLNTINGHPSYFTTSSCSGRISILSQPTSTSSTKPKKKAQGGAWLFITHDQADPDSVLQLLFHPQSLQQPSSDLVFRFEPLIIAVECKDLFSAQALVSIAISSGFRESGITNANKRIIIAIRCSIRLEVPLGNTQKIMVSPEYVRYLISVANEKMETNKKRTDAFLIALQHTCFVDYKVSKSCDQMLHEEVTEDDNHSEGVEGLAHSDGQDGKAVLDGRPGDSHSGTLCDPSFSLSFIQLKIIGEPVGKLLLWGHSACALPIAIQNKMMIFGGFGGMGRHGRRNESLLLDTLLGTLQSINVEEGPSPRMGHTLSLVGNNVFVIGGRAGPLKILNELWVLDITTNKWKLLDCNQSVFPPRHRHAAVAVGSKIYVFGGLENDTVSSSFYVFDTDIQQWKVLPVSLEQPCSRHSHSMVTYGSNIYMFGGYDGEKALGDLYSFDVHACQWKKEKTSGRNPHPRFSHTMFVYKHYLGVIGGCPVKQHSQELALLDLRLQIWKHVTLNSADNYLFVRSTATVIGDDLVMIGGGASCYAFGTKFSDPIKIQLHPLIAFDDNVNPFGNKVTYQPEGVKREKNEYFPGLNSDTESPNLHQLALPYWFLQLERKYAKLGKDILKRFGWLDLGRKVSSMKTGMYIRFPVNKKFCDVFEEEQLLGNALEGKNDFHMFQTAPREGYLLNEVSCSMALNILKQCGASKLEDKVVEIRVTAKSPLQKMSEAVSSLLLHKGLSMRLLEELPTRWERIGDIVILPVTSFKDPIWDTVGEELWPIIANSLNTCRLARQGRIAPTGTRDSTLQILVGENGWVEHRENGIIYSFDVTKCMFSWGNLSEKLRMARLDCKDEIVVDFFAGIGYFVLPFLIGAKAKLVYACEWNPHALEALKRNIQVNCVSDRCIVLEGDNQVTAPKGIADRVCLGLLPTSEGSWFTAVRALRAEGGMLHVHCNVKDSEEGLWTRHLSEAICKIAHSEGHRWVITIEHVERVKWYAPHIRHLVADVRCRKVQDNI